MKTSGTLVILTPGFAASEADSTCLPMQQSFLRTVSTLYPHIKIIILSFQYPYKRKKYIWHGATVYSFNGRNKGGLPRLWLRRTILRTLKRIHHSETIIGLLSFWYGECAAVGNLFGKRNGIEHRCWILGQDARPGNKYPGRYSLPATELVALSDFLQIEFEKNYSVAPAQMVPAAINPQHMPPVDNKKDIDLLGVGSLISLKQYDLFVQLVGALKKNRPHIKAEIAGEGADRAKLEAMISAHALQHNLRLTGELSFDEVLKKMQRARVFVHPSSYEGFSGVCLEALYAGAQVVSFVQPMKSDIEGWHVVKTFEEMLEKTCELLQGDHASAPHLVFDMRDTAQQMMTLFQ